MVHPGDSTRVVQGRGSHSEGEKWGHGVRYLQVFRILVGEGLLRNRTKVDVPLVQDDCLLTVQTDSL